MKSLKSMFGKSGKKTETEMESHSGHQHQHQHQHRNDEHAQTGTKYYCPMHCEGDKLYDSPGNCPVCNMKLVPVSDEKHHSH